MDKYKYLMVVLNCLRAFCFQLKGSVKGRDHLKRCTYIFKI